MSSENDHSKSSIVDDIKKRLTLVKRIIGFVIFTLFAVLFWYVYEPAADYLGFLPDFKLSVKLILAILAFLTIIGLYLSRRISNQVLRMIGDYSSRLERILNITRDLREEMYGDILLEKILDYAISITQSEAGSLLIMDGGSLVFKIVRGGNSEELLGTSIEKGRGVAGWAAEKKQTVRISDASSDDRFYKGIDSVTGFDTKSILCIPLVHNNVVLGVIELLNKKGGKPYRERDEEIIHYLAEQASISIIKTKFYEDQRNYEIHLTDMLLEAMDFHCPEKKGHSRRVARYANIMAKALNMTEEERKALYFASLLHDVGFLKTDPESIFKKEEYMKHPSIGYDMIRPITFYENIAPFILHHHERFDGHGYPSGLRGEKIPLESRIIAVAEAFDSMISQSSYRVPISFREALHELREKGGSQFDPEIVDVFAGNIEARHAKD